MLVPVSRQPGLVCFRQRGRVHDPGDGDPDQQRRQSHCAPDRPVPVRGCGPAGAELTPLRMLLWMVKKLQHP